MCQQTATMWPLQIILQGRPRVTMATRMTIEAMRLWSTGPQQARITGATMRVARTTIEWLTSRSWLTAREEVGITLASGPTPVILSFFVGMLSRYDSGLSSTLNTPRDTQCVVQAKTIHIDDTRSLEGKKVIGSTLLCRSACPASFISNLVVTAGILTRGLQVQLPIVFY